MRQPEQKKQRPWQRAVVIFVSCFFGSLFFASSALAASLTDAHDTLSRVQVSVGANHDIRFVTPTGVDGPADTITLTFAAGFDLSSIVFGDVALSHGPATGFETTETIAAASAAGMWGMNFAGSVITLTAPTNAGAGEITAGHKVVIRIGTADGGTHQIANPSSSDNYPLSIAGVFGDTGSVTLVIISGDTVSVSATVPPTSTNQNGGGGPPAGGGGCQVGCVGGVGPGGLLQITNVAVTQVKPTSVLISWDTNAMADSKVEYDALRTFREHAADGTMVFRHAMALASLLPDTTYFFQLRSKDADDNAATYTGGVFRTAPPPHAPFISNIQVSHITDSSALVTWDTDIDATNEAEYGLHIIYGSRASAPGFVSRHSVTLSGLSPLTTYHFRVASEEETGLRSSSSDGTFTTIKAASPVVNPANFSAIPGDTFVDLAWQNPVDPAFQNVIIRARTDRFPVGRADGRLVYEGRGTSVRDSGLINGTHYFYSLFAINVSDQASSGILADAIPFHGIIPVPPATSSPLIPAPTPPTTEPEKSVTTPATNPSSQQEIQIHPEFYAVQGLVLLFPDARGILGAVAGESLFVKVPVFGLGSLAESGTITAGRDTYRLTRAGQEDAFGASFVLSAAGQQIPLDVSVRFSNGMTATARFVVQVYAKGVVRESLLIPVEPSALSGAIVQLLVQKNGIWSPAASGEIHQANPRITSADGTFFWFAPNDAYRIRASLDGYEPLETDVTVLHNVVRADIGLKKISKTLFTAIQPDVPLGQNAVNVINAVGRSLGALAETVRTPETQAASERVLTPTLVTIGVANLVTAGTLFNIFNYLRFLFTQPLLLFGRRKREKWGTVYNTFTKQPIELAIVRLVSVGQTQVVVQTKITNKHGQFVFLVRPGMYRLLVVKPHYVYPTEYLKEEKVDGDFVDVYHGEMIEVKENAAIAVNIPVDPVIKEETPQEILRKEVWRHVRSAVATFGVFGMGIGVVISPSWWMFGFFAFQVVTYLIFQRLAVPPKPKGWGVVYDQTSKKGVGRAVIRIFSKKFNKLLETQITNEDGKYGFFADKDLYFIKAEREGYLPTPSIDLDLSRKQEGVVDRSIPLQKKEM